MGDLLAAVGLVLVIEGVVYALFPEGAKRTLGALQDLPPRVLRFGGLAALGVGFVIVWAARSL